MRVLLNGEGDPIPLEALPDQQAASGDFVLELETGNFVPADFIALGFAYYECWCVGGAGGRGGDPGGPGFDVVNSRATMSAGDWNLWLELFRVSDRITTGEWDHLYLVSANYPLSGGAPLALTAVQMEERSNPGHKLPVTTYVNAHLIGDPAGPAGGAGGSGGGGGLHVVTGALADLPALVPVLVGAAGVDAGLGQTIAHNAWTPEHDPYPPMYGYLFDLTGLPIGSPQRRLYELYNYFGPKEWKYPAPHPSFVNPVVGGDGGPSSFNGTLCRASGGKGGQPGLVWDHHDSTKAPGYQEIFAFNGAGGAGGLGNRTTAGGGAAGGTETTVDGSDGVWDGVVGAGGGGGRGGSNTGGGFDPRFGVPVAGDTRKPGNGGRGSYSFADTSVFGERQLKSKYPGGGGGSAHLGQHKFGSHALGYLPKGAVLLRITKPA